MHPCRESYDQLGWKQNLSSHCCTKHETAANKKEVIWTANPHALVYSSSSWEGKAEEERLHFGRVLPSARNLHFKDSVISPVFVVLLPLWRYLVASPTVELRWLFPKVSSYKCPTSQSIFPVSLASQVQVSLHCRLNFLLLSSRETGRQLCHHLSSIWSCYTPSFQKLLGQYHYEGFPADQW